MWIWIIDLSIQLHEIIIYLCTHLLIYSSAITHHSPSQPKPSSRSPPPSTHEPNPAPPTPSHPNPNQPTDALGCRFWIKCVHILYSEPAPPYPIQLWTSWGAGSEYNLRHTLYYYIKNRHLKGSKAGWDGQGRVWGRGGWDGVGKQMTYKINRIVTNTSDFIQAPNINS